MHGWSNKWRNDGRESVTSLVLQGNMDLVTMTLLTDIKTPALTPLLIVLKQGIRIVVHVPDTKALLTREIKPCLLSSLKLIPREKPLFVLKKLLSWVSLVP